MRFPQKARAPRRGRIAAFLGLACLFSYSQAGAQADRDWLETALEKTRRLSSPWDLPLKPELDAAPLPDTAPVRPDTATVAAIGLEIPWGRKVQAEAEAEKLTRLDVRLVDDFDDPWSGRTAVETPALDSPDPVDSPDYEESPDLIDPWED